uniref:Virion morphogenesis protein n=1 Tax=Myoviridae sp. ctDvB7 TaxID=2825057 RepID=A0A8S5UEJ9_9CAUD|nr:MAG TPA: virion morphogenesis protein [Myoviridae sp. ctDvB7]
MPIDLQGLEEIQRKLKTLESSLDEAGMRRKLNTIGGMIKNSVEESFENETSPFGQRWKPLSSVTAFANFGGGIKNVKRGRQNAYYKNGKKQKKSFLSVFGAGGSRRILVLSGVLAGHWVVRASAKSVTVSNNSSSGGFAYGLTHQFGTARAGRHRNVHIPARPFLPVDGSGNLEPRLAKDINDYLKGEIIKEFQR